MGIYRKVCYNCGMTTNKRSTSMRLSQTADRLIEAVAKKLGVSKAAVMEMAVRAFAEQHGVTDEAAIDE